MTATSRRVRRLRLSSPDPALIQRGAFLFEDALRVADLPDADSGRLLLIRDLDVGTIASQGSSVPIARVLSERVRLCASAAVHGGDPAAGASVAVYFQDRAEACALLAHRLAAADPVDAWFWALAVPDWRPELDRSTGLRTVLLTMLEIPGGVASVSKLVLDLAAQGNLALLLKAVRPADGEGLLRACGWAKGPRGTDEFSTPPDSASSHFGRSAALEEVLDRALFAWGGDDARTLWLACAALAGERPELVPDHRLPDRARRVVQAAERRRTQAQPAETIGPSPSSAPPEARSRRSDASPSPAASEAIRDDDDQVVAVRKDGPEPPRTKDSIVEQPDPANASSPDHPPIRRRPRPAASGGRASADVAADSSGEEPAASLLPLGGEPSTIAGLLFLLPVLQRLGIEAFAEAHPGLAPWAVPARVMRLLARRLGALEGDPLLAVLSPRDPPDGPTGFSFTVPREWRGTVIRPGRPVWRPLERERCRERASDHGFSGATALPSVLFDTSGRLPLALREGRLPDDLELLVEAWLTAARRWCRRRAGLGLFDLVHRSGQVTATPTHVDVVFDYRLADTRIRRAGLDQNPGWLPWLGRVVQFHYHSLESPDG